MVSGMEGSVEEQEVGIFNMNATICQGPFIHPQWWVGKTTGSVASYISLICFRQHHEYFYLLAKQGPHNWDNFTPISGLHHLWAFKMNLLFCFQGYVSLYIYLVEKMWLDYIAWSKHENRYPVVWFCVHSSLRRILKWALSGGTCFLNLAHKGWI